LLIDSKSNAPKHFGDAHSFRGRVPHIDALVPRREFVRRASLCTGSFLLGLDCIPIPELRTGQGDTVGGKFLGTVEFEDEGRPAMDVAVGEELDGRLFTDLWALKAEDRFTPTEKFYVRTRASKLLPEAKSWTVKINGFAEKPSSLSLEELRRRTKPIGLHLMECAGNARFAHFGLISVAKWKGVPVAEIVEGLQARPQARRVLISGFDQYESKSLSSVAGASWIFSLEELKRAGAFLATEMNDQSLTADHGAPVRLVMPGWYGCTCIKWVDAIALVGEDAEATSQMKEYAARTHQSGVPEMAKEYEPAVIDQAAMPIRVEKWLMDGKIQYRVVGILWGGTELVKELQIRFNPEEDYIPVDHFEQTENDPWGFWSHWWSPSSPGRYSIRLMVKQPLVRTRRLDSGYYVRTVEVSEV
jgi:DMSO/TMAO reductase YedYZ molybdopterin-dependent catalytic subunit